MLRGIVLIVVDCLRADHVSAYGYDRRTTPTLDALAERGRLWEQAYSVSSWTKPSVTSMLTGLYPTQHGAFEGIKRRHGRRNVTTDVLRSSAPTLAETLTNHEWRCGAFINNAQLGEFSRLNRGFETYVPSAGKADHLLASFHEWLEADLDTPMFGYLHFLEAHFPYKPRRRHVRMFGGDRDTNYFRDFSARDFGRLRHAISHGEVELTSDQLEQMVQMYDGAIRRLDGKINDVLAMLEEVGLQDQVAVVVTADHGEEFLEHGRIGHGQTLHEELTHVPLVAFIPGGPSGVRRSDPVSLVNLADTLLTTAGVDVAASHRNLLDLSHSDEPVFSELVIKRRYTQTIRTKEWKLHRRFLFKPANGELDRAGTPFDWAQHCPHEITYELFDVVHDPGEQINLAVEADLAAIRHHLERLLDDWWEGVAATADRNAGHEIEIDEVVVRRLRDLGYLE